MSFILNSGRFGVTDPGLTLLQSATLWLDASDPGSDSQKAQNKGTGGTALDARLGSTTSVDTNDPLLLTHTGTNYLYLPGVAGNYASTPDSVALSITSDIELVARLALPDWTPSTPMSLLGKSAGTGSRSYRLDLNTSGALSLVLSADGTASVTALSSAATGIVDGAYAWLKVTWRNSDDRVQFFTAADQASEPGSWTQLGTDQTCAVTGIFDSTAAFEIGSVTAGTGQPTNGSYARVIVRNGIGGTTVFDADFTANTNQSSFTESSSNAATVTINRTTSGRKSVMVTRPVWLFGTDDYMEIADNALLDIDTSEKLTAVVVMREWGTPVANACFIAKYTANFDDGWGMLRIAAATHQVRAYVDVVGNVTAASGITYSAGALGLRGVQFDRVAQTELASDGSTLGATASISAIGSLVNAAPLRIGSNGGTPASFPDWEVVAVALFKGSTLTSTELGQIATYYGV